MPGPDFLSSAEACALLGIDRSTLSRWSSEGLRPDARKLTPALRLPKATLFHRADVEALARKLAESAA